MHGVMNGNCVRGYRGLFGQFVTRAPDSQVVAAAPHVLLGQELAIDRATPKDRAPAAGYSALTGGGTVNGPQVRIAVVSKPADSGY